MCDSPLFVSAMKVPSLQPVPEAPTAVGAAGDATASMASTPIAGPPGSAKKKVRKAEHLGAIEARPILNHPNLFCVS